MPWPMTPPTTGLSKISSLAATLLPLPCSKLSSINALLMTRIHGRCLSAKMVSLLVAHLQMQRVHQPPLPATTFILSSLWEPFHLMNISITGGKTAKTAAKSASSATTLPATKLTAQKTVPFSSRLVINWSRSSTRHWILTLHLAQAMSVLHLLLPQLWPRWRHLLIVVVRDQPLDHSRLPRRLAATTLAMTLSMKPNKRPSLMSLALSLVWPVTFTCPFHKIRARGFQLLRMTQLSHLLLPPTLLATTQHRSHHVIRWVFAPLHYQSM